MVHVNCFLFVYQRVYVVSSLSPPVWNVMLSSDARRLEDILGALDKDPQVFCRCSGWLILLPDFTPWPSLLEGVEPVIFQTVDVWGWFIIGTRHWKGFQLSNPDFPYYLTSSTIQVLWGSCHLVTGNCSLLIMRSKILAGSFHQSW